MHSHTAVRRAAVHLYALAGDGWVCIELVFVRVVYIYMYMYVLCVCVCVRVLF
jgi:hypothetical protein